MGNQGPCKRINTQHDFQGGVPRLERIIGDKAELD